MQTGELVNKDGVKFPIQKHGRLYYLCKTSTDNVRSGSLEAWHKIRGHCNKGDVENLEKVVRGMKITEKSDFDCKSCVLGKRQLEDVRAAEPLEFVHSHLSDAIDLIARDGFRYGMPFIDDDSGAIFIYFLKQKSNAVNASHKFLADAAPFAKVRRIKSDNGGENLSEEFKSVLI